METAATSIVTALLGGGAVGIVTVVSKALRDRAAGRIAREDTAITRWRDLANEYQRESDDRLVAIQAFRRWYVPLWSAYMGKSPPHQYFPVDPTQPDQGAPSAASSPLPEED